MGEPRKPSEEPQERLAVILEPGLSHDPVEHSHQVAAVAGILTQAFEKAGLIFTLVGGSAIEIHAPGVHLSHDLDVVVEGSANVRESAAEVFRALGFERQARHWVWKDKLFVETVPWPVAGPTEVVHLGEHRFRIVTKEVPLRDRIVGFKHWKVTGYGVQAIGMLAAFAGELDEDWLLRELRREGAVDALEALRRLIESEEEITDEALRELLGDLQDPSGSG
jgi:hypothetical protein